MITKSRFKKVVAIIAGLILVGSGAVVMAGEWQSLAASKSVEDWKFNPETTKVERVADPDHSSHEVMEIQGMGARGGELQHAIASFTSNQFQEMPVTGGTLFFRMRVESGEMFNGRLVFSPAVLNAANQSCGFRFVGKERIAFSGLDAVEDIKAFNIPTAQWLRVWFSPNPSERTATIVLDVGDGKSGEMKVKIKDLASSDGDPLSFFGIVVSKLDVPRAVLLGDFYWSKTITTEVPPEAAGL